MISLNSKIILTVLFGCVAIGQSKDCPKVCTLEYNPICATNGREFRLFGNQCTFKAFECETHSVWTSLRSLTPCSAEDTTDYLAGCETPCTREYRPVCGTNGDRFEFFNNLCLMKNAHCRDGKTWHQTRNSDCKSVSSKLSADSQTNCEKPCTFILNPVCGFNGKHPKLFDNLCIMNNEHCKDGLTWFQTRMMDCLARTEPVNCDKPCPLIYAPICGFDGKSYQMFDNSCVMEVASCNRHVVYVDAPLSACENTVASAKKKCEKACPRIYAPICGFDGQSYQMFDNSCIMEIAACDQHVTFTNTPLSACEIKTAAKENNDCIKACPFIYAPTCGFDGKSYQMFDNSCIMEVASCNQHVTFLDAPLSACDKKTVEEECAKFCPLIYAPVCGFDGNSFKKYANACIMEAASCNQHITFVEHPLIACVNVPMIV